MLKILGSLMMAGGIMLFGTTGAVAIGVIDQTQTVKHSGVPLDPNGCHIGPSGFHCH